MKEWCVIFKADLNDDYLQNGMEVYQISSKTEDIPIKGVLREMPTAQAVPEYNFENYNVGVSKGYNYCLEDLKGLPHGTYDPTKHDLHTH